MYGDGDSEGRWVTYADLAAARGIDRQSAAKLSFRRHWRRQKDNQGMVRVCVPPDWLRPERDTSGDVSGKGSGDMSAVIKPLQEAVDALRTQLDRAEAGKEAADRHADQERARADAERARADRAEAEREAADRRAGCATRITATGRAGRVRHRLADHARLRCYWNDERHR